MEKIYPESWKFTPLENLITYVIGGDWGKEPDETIDDNYQKVYCIRASEIRDWNNSKGKTASLRKIKATSLASRKLQEQDIIIEISGGGPEQPVGRTVLIDKESLAYNSSTPKICTNFFRLLRPSALINAKFLNTYLQYFYKTGEINKYQAGSNNLRNLKFSDYCQINIPIPPINEQHCIIAKIEELFSKLDKGTESLKAAQAQLKNYRQSLLKEAFAGKLTATWRAQQADKLEAPEQLLARIQQEREARYQQQLADWQQAVKEWEQKGKEGKKPSCPKEKQFLEVNKELIELLPTLPTNYKYIFLDQLGELARGKSKHRPRNDPKLFGGEYPFIQTGEVKAANRVITTYTQTLNKVGLAQSKLWPKGTLCITIAANIAETAFLGFDGCFPDSIVGYTAYNNIVDPRYIELFIKAAKEKISAYAPATAQKNINLTTLENLVIPYTTLDEQLAIINQVDKQFSVIDNNLEIINSCLTKSQSLRQSILKKAFAGELVPQDPTDEPASELLKRIAQEKAQLAQAQAKARKTKKGNKKP